MTDLSHLPLKDRLRMYVVPSHKSWPTHPRNPDGEEAAAEIERLEAASRAMVRAWALLRQIATIYPGDGILYEGEVAGDWEAEARAILALANDDTTRQHPEQ